MLDLIIIVFTLLTSILSATAATGLFIGSKLKPWNYPEPTSSYILKNNKGVFEIDIVNSKNFKDWGMVSDA